MSISFFPYICKIITVDPCKVIQKQEYFGASFHSTIPTSFFYKMISQNNPLFEIAYFMLYLLLYSNPLFDSAHLDYFCS